MPAVSSIKLCSPAEKTLPQNGFSKAQKLLQPIPKDNGRLDKKEPPFEKYCQVRKQGDEKFDGEEKRYDEKKAAL